MPNLKQYGFLEAGEWIAYPNVKSRISFELSDSFKKERVVYAFVVEGTVKYIGVCEGTTTTLTDRMKRHKNMTGGGTNERIAQKIKDCLDEKKTVKIFALKPKTLCRYCGLTIDLVNGLKNPLIQKFKPEWNIRN